MRWESEIDIEMSNRVRGCLSVEEIQSLLLSSLTKDELEEFAGELIKGAAARPVYLGDE